MSRTNKGFISLCIPLLAILIIFNGCEDPGSVGSEYVDRPTLTFDTLSISNTEALSYEGYSGKLGFIPMGQYSDALFGDVGARALFRPSISPPLPDSVDLEDTFTMKLRLRLDSLETYGDTLSESGFSIYEITSNWRGTALRIDDEIQYGTEVGSFTIGQEDEVIVDLDQQWIDEYKSYYYSEDANVDSLYTSDFRGLIIVSNQQNSKISFSRSDRTRFLLINGVSSDTTDTIAVPLRDWGFTMDRANAVNTPNTFPLHTTLESMMSITMPDSILKADNNTKNIIRADLVFYEAEEELNNALPSNHVRLDVASLNLDLVADLEPVYEYQFGQVDFSGPADSDKALFKINVTNYVNNVIFGDENRKELILGIGSASGTIRSTLLYDFTAPEDVRPKLIITSLVD